MEWTRTETIALSMEGCTRCQGVGLRDLTDARESPCQCVFRSIFRACYARFRQCCDKENYLTHVTLEPSKGRHRYAYGRKGEEYVVDFLNVSRHGLSDEEYRVFRYHYLLGADWKLCTVRLGMDRGNFFHMCYRIESRLGRIFRELQPYALYPLDEYFASPMKGSRAFPAGGAKVIPMGPPPKVINPDKLERLLRKRSPAKKAA